MVELGVASQFISSVVSNVNDNVDDANDPEEEKKKPLLQRGASHLAKKPCRVLLFTAFVTMMFIFVYIIYLLLSHFTELFTSDTFWNNVKDIVSVYAKNCTCIKKS